MFLFGSELYNDLMERASKKGYTGQLSMCYAEGCGDERIELLLRFINYQMHYRGLSYHQAVYTLGLTQEESDLCYPYIKRKKSKSLLEMVEEMTSSGAALLEQGRQQGDLQQLISLLDITRKKLDHHLDAVYFLGLSSEDRERLSAHYAREQAKADSLGQGLIADGIEEGSTKRLLKAFETVMPKLGSFDATVAFFELSDEDVEKLKAHMEGKA